MFTKSFIIAFFKRLIESPWPITSKRVEKGSTNSKKITKGRKPKILIPSKYESGLKNNSSPRSQESKIVMYREKHTTIAATKLIQTKKGSLGLLRED